MEYPWYEDFEDGQILQGDFLDACPTVVPPSDFAPERQEEAQVEVELREYNVIVMSQSCDLLEGKLDLVLLCPHWSLEEVGQSNEYFKSRKGKNALRKGNVPGYHMLAECTLPRWERGITVVDFRTVFSLPYEFLQSFTSSHERRLRLCPPYREHLSQAFARFFMRVGLPVDIAQF